MRQHQSILHVPLRLESLLGKLLASTTLVCVAVVASNNGLAKTTNTTAPNLSAHSVPGTRMNGDGTAGGAKHNHRQLEVPSDRPIPAVGLIVHEDPLKGWNLEVQTFNFSFAPQKASTTTQTTAEGHAHLYIDGQKITRLYSNWYYLENLKPGSHRITVGLNANGHEALAHKGKPIETTQTIEAAALGNQGDRHRH